MLDLPTLHALVELAERSGAVLLVDETYRDLTHGDAAADGRDAVPARDQRVVDVEGVRRCPGCASVGRCAAIRDARRARCSRPRNRWSSAAPRSTRRSPAAVLARASAHPAADPRRRARPARRRARLDRRPGHVRVGRTRGRRRRARAVRARRRGRHRAASTSTLLAEYGTYVGPGHWFEVDDRHFRLGFGWPTIPELHAGLAALTAAARTAG